MCGRFAFHTMQDALVREFDIRRIEMQALPNYNIAPTQDVVAIVQEDGGNALVRLRWGLIPFWAKDPAIGNQMINARAETLAEKPSFKNAFKRQRCLIPASGFFEWKKDGKTKKPLFVRMRSGAMFTFAGLWDSWRSPSGDIIRSCTIVTTEPNELMSQFHHRMPIILDGADRTAWLDRATTDTERLLPLLKKYPAALMEAFEVSTRVNSPANNVPECMLPVPGGQLHLFPGE